MTSWNSKKDILSGGDRLPLNGNTLTLLKKSQESQKEKKRKKKREEEVRSSV